MLRGCASAAAALLAFAAAAWANDAPVELDSQSCDAAPRRAGPDETVFAGVGDIERESWPAERSPVSDDALRRAAAPWSGAPLDIATVRCVGLAMERTFRNAGYPYTRVSAPPQRVEAGMVRYQVVEGWVERVSPAGDDARARLQAYRHLRSLEAGGAPGPLSLAEIERAAALLEEAPGLNARMAITRGAEDRPGAIRIVADAAREPRDLVVNVNNYGAEELGRTGFSALFSTPGRAPLGDKFTFSAYATADIEEQRAVRVTYERGLTASGLAASLDIAYGEAEPGGEVQVLGAAAESVTARMGLTYPILYGRRTRARIGAGVDGADQTDDLFGGQVRLSEDSTRNVFARLEGESSPGCARFTAAPEGACWRVAGEIEGRKGLSGLGASEEGDARLARPLADPQAAVVRGAFEVETPAIPGGLRGRLVLSGQAADGPLMAFEEFILGNYTMVRGYDPGAVAGDSGAAAALEVIGPELRVRRFGVEPFGFVDAGRVWNDEPGAPDGRDIASYGAGVRVGAAQAVRLEATWSRPLHPPLGLGESEPRARVLFSLTASVPRLVDWAA
jgi:hemolysin activation/secretion protein